MIEAPPYSNTRNPFNYAKVEQVDRDLSTQWLTLDEIAQQLNLFQDESQDDYLKSIELATRMAIEDYLGLSITETQWRVYYPNIGLYAAACYLDLPEVSQATQYGAGVTIDSVQLYTSNGLTTVDSSYYSYDPTGNRVILTSMSDLDPNIANPIVVTYTQNASPIGAYPVVKQAALMMLTHLYNNRSNTIAGTLNEIPFGVAALLRPYKPLVM